MLSALLTKQDYRTRVFVARIDYQIERTIDKWKSGDFAQVFLEFFLTTTFVVPLSIYKTAVLASCNFGSRQQVDFTTGPHHQFWLIISRFLPAQAYDKCFEPSFEDLKHKQLNGKGKRLWILFCFHAEAAWLIAESLRVWFWAKILLILKVVWGVVIGG